MFTGIIQKVGEIEAMTRKGGGGRVSVRAPFEGPRLGSGESVSVDGACLTVAASSAGRFEADLSGETLARTTAGSWRKGRRVNLERSLAAGERLGGHLVMGHVDGTGRVLAMRQGAGQVTLRVRLPAALRSLVAEKGSVAIDGVSLTVSALGATWLEVALVPYTLEGTNLSDRRTGDTVNLEGDVIARYVARILETRSPLR